jgi:3-oxoacyl-[acyl-carrier protein] reductase
VTTELVEAQKMFTPLQVALVYTSPASEEKSKKIASDISSMNNGSKAHIIQADLKQIEAPEKIVASTREAFGDKIDILINNAGVLWANSIEETTAEDYAGIFDVNVRAPLLLTKAVVPHLRKPGRIINMSSVGARIGPPKLSLYAASKAAIEGMTKSLAHELGDAGHTVNAVAPGPVESDMLADVSKELVDRQMKATAVEHRLGTVDDIARIVCFLASEDSKWVSGQTISASGGFLMV